MTSNQIRHTFLEFFKNRNHTIVASAPLPIKNDSSLMFTNAGMNQFKDIFLGISPIKHKRIADTQKCLRVSGKHNDLEDVGFDTYHHTFFEMLGNWSFGDYFKKEAIELAWELLTEVYKLPKNRLYATFFKGDKNLEKDTETQSLWSQYLPEDHIIEGNAKDNFWEMGSIGPCGPCSELHIDLRNEEEINRTPGYQLVNKNNDRVIELWNLVFMQYNRKADGVLEPLPHNHVDTGMGFERLCMVLQNKISNYDTDLFAPLIKFIQESTNIKYTNTNALESVAMRVISDHSRAITMAIADNEIPSNTSGGYVIRRMLRRAVRYSYSYLNQKEPFLYKLVPIISQQFQTIFPEIKSQLSFIENTVREEEKAFINNLESGLHRISKHLKNNKNISGKFAFELYDTFGFPIDLTQTIAKENYLTIDINEFNQCLEEQKQRSRAATNITYRDWNILIDNSITEFIGYTSLETTSKITRYRTIINKGCEQIQIVLDKTPFYAESGGQIGDTGLLILADKCAATAIKIVDTIKENKEIIHIIDKLPENLQASFIAKVDKDRRCLTSANHSATHLLGLAINKILGEKIFQKGSYVSDRYFRFDFTYPSKISDKNLQQIEAMVNDMVRATIPLEENTGVPVEEAIKMGAKAVFEDKYEDLVRVIKFGDSIELCGGSHVGNTGKIGLFKIISEKASSSGVRRIEAITGPYALEYVNNIISENKQAKQLLKASDSLTDRIEKLLEEKKSALKELQKVNESKIAKIVSDLHQHITTINDISLSELNLVDTSLELLKSAAMQFSLRKDAAIIIATTLYQGEKYLTIITSKDLAKNPKLASNSLMDVIERKNHITSIVNKSTQYSLALLNRSIDSSRIVKEIELYIS
ncbi:MAG: alanine--tRNA ligase [Solitalea-like symbiont of Tyrophagus putrescentiae]